MKFEQLEFLKKKMEAVALGISGRSYYTYDKGQKEKELMDRVGNVQDMLRSMASVADCFLGMLMDDKKAKEQDPWEQEVEELSDTLTRSKQKKDKEARRQEFELEYNKAIEIAKGKDWQHAMFQQYGLRDGKPPTGNDAWVIPYCIDELLKINKKLREYTPSNPELAKLTIQEIVCKLSIEMQIQNNVLMTALRHLMGKTDE
jgi:hypothetical protein